LPRDKLFLKTIGKSIITPKNSKIEKPIFGSKVLPELKKTPSIWEEIKTFYLIEHKIGAGTYGTVYAARCIKTGSEVAIKHIENFSRHEYDSLKVIREI